MKNIKRKLSALVLSTVFASMQVSMAAIDTGLGNGNGGAVINNATGGLVDVTKGVGTANLNFNADTHVNWNTLNVNSNEALNFNAVQGANNLTILNTVNQGMSKIYGQINANDGIGKLIISNPNGMLYDGAKFTTAGDLMLTTKNIAGLNDINNATYTKVFDSNGKIIPIQIKNSKFEVNGDYVIEAPYVSAEASKVIADNFKITTTNGLEYQALGATAPANNVGITYLKAMNIDGNVYIVNDEGAMSISNGGVINGDLNVETKGNTFVNHFTDANEVLAIKGDANVKSHGQWAFVRNTSVDGDLTMSNDGGFVDVGNIDVKGDANLTTTGLADLSSKDYNHYVHVIGNSSVGGDLNVEASQNIHIGGYDYDARQLADGNLVVGGDLNAHSTDGHITTTIDTTAKNIRMTSDKLNVLTDDKAVLTADTYEFKSAGYIGGISDYQKPDGTVLKKDDQIVNLMENYTFIPSIKSKAYTNIAGGKITKLETPYDAYIASKGDLEVTGANANNINLTAYNNSKITIESPDVHAKNVNIGGETGYLKLNFPERDFTTNYTNIRDGVVTTIAPNEVITYELTDGPNGYNQPTLTPGEKTTYLIGPGTEPVPPVPPTEEQTPPGDEPGRQIAQWVPDDIMQDPVNTPVAFAADLDDDDNGQPVRKNVDGSVTVVRAFAVGK